MASVKSSFRFDTAHTKHTYDKEVGQTFYISRNDITETDAIMPYTRILVTMKYCCSKCVSKSNV